MGDQEKLQTRAETVEELIRAFVQFRRSDLNPSSQSACAQNKSEARLVILLDEHGSKTGMKVSELSTRMRVTSPFVTQLLTSAEEKGLVMRQIDPNDRRMIRVFLTEKGKQAAEEYKNELRRWFSDLAQYLGEEDSRQLIRLMHKLFHYLRNHEN